MNEKLPIPEESRAEHGSGTSVEGAAPQSSNARPPGRRKALRNDEAGSFGLVRSLALAAMALTVILSVVVAIYLGNYAGRTVLRKNENFAALLADNLNNQIYRRFTLPTISIFGRIALRNPEQYKQLDTIIQSIIQGLHVYDVRIYSHDHTIAYSTNPEELGNRQLAGPSVDLAATAEGPLFEMTERIPYWQAFFRLSLQAETFRMRTTYPLRIENRLSSSEAEGPIMGVLEFTQDVTQDVKSTIRFQQLVLAVTLLSSGMLLFILLLLVRRAERALANRMVEEQRLQAELHQHEKLAGMGRVVASIAHEIRNPLGIISSSAEFLLRRAEGADSGTSRILQAIYDEARRLSRTVSDFLDYARPRQPKRDMVDTSTLLSQALAFLGPELTQREIGVVRTGELDTPLWVAGDKDLLYRAFYNILGNAMQATGHAGTITVTLSRTEGPPSEVELVFHDSGPGFPPESMEQLLDPFFTTKDDGTGLGLPIVNTIITSHGGSLSLTNAARGGAEVRVRLPGLPSGTGAPPSSGQDQ